MAQMVCVKHREGSNPLGSTAGPGVGLQGLWFLCPRLHPGFAEDEICHLLPSLRGSQADPDSNQACVTCSEQQGASSPRASALATA